MANLKKIITKLKTYQVLLLFVLSFGVCITGIVLLKYFPLNMPLCLIGGWFTGYTFGDLIFRSF